MNDHQTDIQTDNLIQEEPQELVVHDQPMPIHGGDDMAIALDAYKELQAKLDEKMPECIIEVAGKPFRTKQYWRTIARAFGLSVGEVDSSEKRITEGDDWGIQVTYRAVNQAGSYSDGDGACMLSEKYGSTGTMHNIRSHAHTRAFNRAVSNLVGFGEVSADECVNYAGEPVNVNKVQAPRKEVGQAIAKDNPAGPMTISARIVDGIARTGEMFPGVNLKEGTTNGREWKLWVINFDNGSSGATFEEEIATYAQSIQDREVLVEAVLVPQKKKRPEDRQNYTVSSLSEKRDEPEDKPEDTPKEVSVEALKIGGGHDLNSKDMELTAEDIPF